MARDNDADKIGKQWEGRGSELIFPLGGVFPAGTATGETFGLPTEKKKIPTGLTQRPVASPLARALARADRLHDPHELADLPDRNADGLRRLVKLIGVLVGWKVGARFFLGSLSAAGVLRVSHVTVRKWLARLGDGLPPRGNRPAVPGLEIVREKWKGRRCACAADGTVYANGARVNRASEYEFRGLEQIGGAR